MIKVVLVDNEKPLLDELEPDAVFLDIDMPILNGLNLAREIMNIDSTISIIFITGFNHYAVQAFEVNAIDYIMKPVRSYRLDVTIDNLLLSVTVKCVDVICAIILPPKI